ncbi:MAG: glycosyltransferase [Desulfomonilia bacterium]
MNRSRRLRLFFYLNILLIISLIGYKVYLMVAEPYFEAVHALQVERIEELLEGRTTYSFAVVGNINNSVGIFERKIIPMLNASGADFVVSAGDAVLSGGEDKYRAIYRSLSRLRMPYLLTYGEHEHSLLGGYWFYDHFGPYLFAFSAGNSRFVFLDCTGKTAWGWQLRWLKEELSVGHGGHTFIFSGQPLWPVDRRGLLGFDSDPPLSEDLYEQFTGLVERFGVDAVFSAHLPVFSLQHRSGTSYVVTGGAGGLVLNTDHSYYHYLLVTVDGGKVDITPVRLEIGQHAILRTLESLWFFVHSLFYVDYLNFLLVMCVLVCIAIWLYFLIFRERDFYPDFDLDLEPFLVRRLRVAMFTNNFLPFIGGVPISIDRLRRGLDALGHRVLVVAPRYESRTETESEPDTIRIPSIMKMGKKNEFRVANLLAFRELRKAAAFRPDVIHLHHPFWLGSAGLFIARRLKVPAVYTYHTRLEHYAHFVPLPGALFRNLISHAMIKRFANLCDAVVVPTGSAEDYLRTIGVRSAIFVQPTGIEYDRFQQVDAADLQALRTRLGIDRERVLISISRLSREKNLDFMLDAIQTLARRSRMPFKLVIVGQGADMDRLADRIRAMGLTEKVLLTGAVPPEEIPLYCALGDVFVFTSRSETQGMVILEAMAAGMPVVAVRSSGIDDIVQDGFNGYKTPQDTERWSARVEELLVDNGLRERLSKNARKFAAAYSIERFGQEMSRVYAHVLAARAKGRGGGLRP